MSIKILLNEPGILSPGATISGSVICQFEQPEVIRGITCIFKGREYTHWTVQRSKNSVNFEGKYDFLSQERQFAHAGTLPARRFEYQFVFKLPDRQLPSTFTDKHAAIQYFIEAKVDRPFTFDYKHSVSLHVISPIDLNDYVDQLCLRPSRNQLEEFPSCCYFTSEPLLLDFTINKDAFIVGEDILVNINVNNTSSLRISGIKLGLIQRLHLTVENPDKRQKEEEKVITEIRAVGVDAHSERDYDLRLRIPDNLLVPLFLPCQLIKLTWAVRAKFKFSSCQDDICCESAIKVGHVTVGTTGVIADLPLSAANISSTSIDYIPTAPLVEHEEGAPISVKELSELPSYNEVVDGDPPKYGEK